MYISQEWEHQAVFSVCVTSVLFLGYFDCYVSRLKKVSSLNGRRSFSYIVLGCRACSKYPYRTSPPPEGSYLDTPPQSSSKTWTFFPENPKNTDVFRNSQSVATLQRWKGKLRLFTILLFSNAKNGRQLCWNEMGLPLRKDRQKK